MTTRAAPPPISLDPLIGEARQRRRRRRLRISAALLVVAAFALVGTAIPLHRAGTSGAGGDRVALNAFVGAWGGHGKGLSISASGDGTEGFSVPAPGYTARFLRVRFHITRVWGSLRRPFATAIVTEVHLPFPNSRATFSAPRVGDDVTLRIVRGVLYGPIGARFCNARTPDPLACGA